MTVLTPTDVQNIAFRKPPLGRRGYDEEEVDSFLDRVEASLTVLYEEIARLRTELDATSSPAATSHGAPEWTDAAMYPQPSGNWETPPYLPQPYHSHEPPPETLLKTELDLIKRRLAWIEQVLGAVVSQTQSPRPPHAT